MKKSFDRRQFLAASLAGSASLMLPGQAGARTLPASARLVTPDQPDYETWRQAMIWQARKPDRRPAAIVRVSGADDVPDVIAYAKRQGLKVAVKSGGHHLWGATLREGALTLDLGMLANVAVDAAAGQVAVGPALWSRELALALSREGLAFPVAHCATVPMGGYLLGGGFGVNGDTWGGMACFRVEGADVVDADGRPRRIDRKEDPDLFWAMRGAGNGFPAVVTRYYLRADSLPRAITESVYLFPLERAGEIAALVAGLAADGLPNTELMMMLVADPSSPADWGPPERICALRAVCFADSPQEARNTLAPLHEHPLIGEALFSVPHQATSMDRLELGSIDYRAQFGYGRYLVDSDWSRPAGPRPWRRWRKPSSLGADAQQPLRGPIQEPATPGRRRRLFADGACLDGPLCSMAGRGVGRRSAAVAHRQFRGPGALKPRSLHQRGGRTRRKRSYPAVLYPRGVAAA